MLRSWAVATLAGALLALPATARASAGSIGGNEGGALVELTVAGSEALEVSSLALLGLKIPTHCSAEATMSLTGREPITALEAEVPLSGNTDIGRFTCNGSLLGSLFGEVVTDLLSGESNATTLTAKS